MSLTVEQLNGLLDRLSALLDALTTSNRPPEAELADNNPLVAQAKSCDFFLPSPLTIGALTNTVRHKIDSVRFLIARAKTHEDMPADVQAAADNEDMLLALDNQGQKAASSS